MGGSAYVLQAIVLGLRGKVLVAEGLQRYTSVYLVNHSLHCSAGIKDMTVCLITHNPLIYFKSGQKYIHFFIAHRTWT